MIIIGGILVLFIYIKRLAPNKIFSPSNKIHREVGRAKDLSAPLYLITFAIFAPYSIQQLYLECRVDDVYKHIMSIYTEPYSCISFK